MKDSYIYYLTRDNVVVSPPLTVDMAMELMEPEYHDLLCVPADDKQPTWSMN